MKTTYALLIFILLTHFSWANVDFCEDDSALNTCAQDDYVALRALYLSTNGDTWTDNTGWPSSTLLSANSTTPPSGYENLDDWYGVIMQNGCIIQLSLPNNNLIGTIPPELGDIDNLGGVILYSNQLNGSIPGELGDLSNLTDLVLANNQLSGSIPPEITMLSNLDFLQLSNNQLSGSLPVPAPGELANLTRLWIRNNQLTGSIPSAFENLVSLESLQLDNNQLSGNIPSELGSLMNLSFLWLSNNQLSGNIPETLGGLSNLTSLTLFNNQLTGCYDENLMNLCDQITTSINTWISNGNILDAPWEDFCDMPTMPGICACSISLPVSGIIPSNIYQAGNDITSDGTVPTGNNVQFKAGQCILLDNDFTVEPNADFFAEIEDCGN